MSTLKSKPKGTKIDFDKLSLHRTPEKSPGFLLWRVSTAWRRAVEEALKPCDLTHPQFVILANTGWLTRTGDSISQAEIGRHAGLDPNTTSQILRCLQKKGLIESTRSADERSKHPTLTTEGLQCLKQSMLVVEGVNTAFFAPLDLKKSGLLDILQALI